MIFLLKYNKRAMIIIRCVTYSKIVFSKQDFIIISEIVFIFADVYTTVNKSAYIIKQGCSEI